VELASGAQSIEVSGVATRPSLTPLGEQLTARFGDAERSATYFVAAAPEILTALMVAPSSVAAGAVATGTVELSRPAPSPGLDIQLRSSSNAIQVPNTVRVRAGFSRATFDVRTTATTEPSATITATLGTITRTAVLNLSAVSAAENDVEVTSVSFDRAVYVPGQTVTVAFAIRNNGSRSTGVFVVEVSGWHRPNEVGFITFPRIGPIGPGTTSTGTVVLPIAGNAGSGTYTVRVKADYWDEVRPEVDDANNVRQGSFEVRGSQ
jgi:hypothetical protein